MPRTVAAARSHEKMDPQGAGAGAIAVKTAPFFLAAFGRDNAHIVAFAADG